MALSDGGPISEGPISEGPITGGPTSAGLPRLFLGAITTAEAGVGAVTVVVAVGVGSVTWEDEAS